MYTIDKKLGLIIKRQRKVKGLSTHKFAKLVDASSGLINKIENTKSNTFNLELLVKILNELDIPILDVFSPDVVQIKETLLNGTQETIILNLKVPNLQNIDLINHYITLIINSLLELLLQFEDTPSSIETVCSHILNELLSLEKIKSLD